MPCRTLLGQSLTGNIDNAKKKAKEALSPHPFVLVGMWFDLMVST
jgi:hypothetical protein